MSEFVRVANLAEISVGQVRVFQVAGKRIAVCNVDGQMRAAADLCTHDGGPLGEGELVDNQIECPRHGARFDVNTGKALCLPAIMPIATYEIENRDGELWIATQPNVPNGR